MIYAVDRYVDVLKVKDERETVPDFGGKRSDKYHYFDTEGSARAFIRIRAAKAVKDIEVMLKRAKAREKKCEKKFAFRVEDARGVLKIPPGYTPCLSACPLCDINQPGEVCVLEADGDSVYGSKCKRPFSPSAAHGRKDG